MALSEWLQTDPHILDSNCLANRNTLMQICLGLGIILEDIAFILAIIDEIPDDLPGYIIDSFWEHFEQEVFQNYLGRLHGDLLRAVEQPRCAICCGWMNHSLNLTAAESVKPAPEDQHTLKPRRNALLWQPPSMMEGWVKILGMICPSLPILT